MTSGTGDEAIARGESPPQRFDLIMVAPFIGLLFFMVSFIYYYRLKEKDVTMIERKFSYILFFTQLIGLIISYCYTFEI